MREPSFDPSKQIDFEYFFQNPCKKPYAGSKFLSIWLTWFAGPSAGRWGWLGRQIFFQLFSGRWGGSKPYADLMRILCGNTHGGEEPLSLCGNTYAGTLELRIVSGLILTTCKSHAFLMHPLRGFWGTFMRDARVNPNLPRAIFEAPLSRIFFMLGASGTKV